MLLHANSEDADQTRRMPRLIRVFAERTGHFIGFVVPAKTMVQYQSLILTIS